MPAILSVYRFVQHRGLIYLPRLAITWTARASPVSARSFIVAWPETVMVPFYQSSIYFHHGFGHDITLNWDLFSLLKKISWPKSNLPTVNCHGKQDDTVPIENSRRVANEIIKMVEIVEVDDGHRMQEACSCFGDTAPQLGLE